MTDTTVEWKKWLTRVDSRKEKFERGWWKQAKVALKMYTPEGNESDDPFNILYANTEVLLPSLYSATPRPDVAVRNDAPQAPAKAAEQFLRTVIDDNSPGMESFDCAVEGAVLSGLVPGGGGVRLRAYKGEAHPIRWEEFKYDQMIWGYAKKWSRVPWVAFFHSLSREDLLAQFKDLDPTKLKEIESAATRDESEEKKEGSDYNLIELWVKDSRKIVWLCAEYTDILLEEMEDGLQLGGFYPTPGPLTLIRKPQDLTPTPLFAYYRKQSEELNRVTVRLNKVLEAIKVRGGYAANMADELSTILDTDDMENKMIAMRSVSADISLDKLVWMLPIDKLITVAKELYGARAQIVATIQQITGLADIVRGASVASETATAQELKNKWGTIRLRRMQTTVAKYVRDLLRLAIDAATTVCPPEEWRKITGLPYPMAVEKQQAQQQVEEQMLAYSQQAMLAGPGQPPQGPPGMPGMPGQPPGMGMAPPQGPPPGPPQPPQGPPPIDPKLQEILSSPSWEEILKLLSDDAARCYIIDIETSSTIDADASADKQEAGEFMAAFGQLVTGMAPLAELGDSGINLAKAIVGAVCKRFKLGREVDEAIKALQPPPPQQNEGEQVKLEVEKMKLQGAKEKADLDRQKAQMDMALKQQQHQMEMEKMAAQHKVDMAKIQAQNQSTVLQAQVGMQSTAQQAQLGAQKHQQGMQAVGQKAQVAGMQHQQNLQATDQQAELGATQHKQKMQAAKARPKPGAK